MSFNEETQKNKIRPAYASGPCFRNPNLSPSMTFTDGVHPWVTKKMQADPFSTMPTRDPWGKHRK